MIEFACWVPLLLPGYPCNLTLAISGGAGRRPLHAAVWQTAFYVFAASIKNPNIINAKTM